MSEHGRQIPRNFWISPRPFISVGTGTLTGAKQDMGIAEPLIL